PETVWLQGRVPWWLRGFAGVFHGTFNALPAMSRLPSVVTIHDLSFEQHPEDFSASRRWSYVVQARHAARAAGAVTTLSTFTRDALVDAYQLDPDRVFITPPAVDPVFAPERAEGTPAILASLGAAAPYLVIVGGAPRRGLRVGVEAWRRWREQGGVQQLVVVGPEVPPALAGIVHAGAVDDGTWAALLAGADALCYPTRYEGFGMPALEALASGTPVVCATTGPLPEVLGDAAEWCPSAAAGDIAAGLARVLGDGDRHALLVAKGLARAAAAPTWAQTASILLEAYALVAGDR
ncbi:MAG TPA: glycosyltransferase, partial [Acidimicrobiales bacterium]|nr:glycosyltransferase [Acidimicrobiales bacterium]